jgi:hypothetical protein
MARDEHGIRREVSPRRRFTLLDGLPPLQAFLRSQPQSRTEDVAELCELLGKVANAEVGRRCSARSFTVDSIFMPCKTPGAGAATHVLDLVVLIDTSGSMTDEAQALSGQADAAITAAAAACPSDLRVKWFGLEGTFPGTKFDTKLRDYLHSLGIADADIDHRVGSIGQEDGGAAIKDVAEHFDWRGGAARAVLFLGDEPLAAGSPQAADDVAAADAAIAAANAAAVKVFTYAGTGIEAFFDSATGVRAQDEYVRLASSTGGLSYSAQAGNLQELTTVLQEVICSASGGECQTARMPELRPCFNLRWGDGPNDHVETDDVEIMCLVASNPYTNVTFADVTAYLVVVGPNGRAPALLPDGTPSVIVRPDVGICFGDLGPCGPRRNGPPKAVSREVVMINRGAAEGQYYVLVVYCFEVSLHLAGGSIFTLDLVKS